jgi:hypothetical protein
MGGYARKKNCTPTARNFLDSTVRRCNIDQTNENQPKTGDASSPPNASPHKPADPSLWNSAVGRRAFLSNVGKASAVSAIASTGMMFEVAYATSVQYQKYNWETHWIRSGTGATAAQATANRAITWTVLKDHEVSGPTVSSGPAYARRTDLEETQEHVTGPVNGVYTSTEEYIKLESQVVQI